MRNTENIEDFASFAKFQNEQCPERAESPVGQEHVAGLENRPQPRQLAHLLHVQAHHRKLDDHAGGQVQQPEQLDGREPQARLLRRRLRPETLERRLVRRGDAGRIRHVDGMPQP
jgi:hypothetical protein